MDMNHVKGKNKGHISLYTLSTCGWCRKTKQLLDKAQIEYHYTDVDLLKGQEREEAMKELKRWNPACTFPTLVIDGKCIIGYQEKEIKETIGL